MIYHTFKRFKKYFKSLCIGSCAAFAIYFAFCLPANLFEQPYSKILLDRNGELLEARIASDNQWRFPLIDSVPPKFESCILRFEDQTFHRHIGISAQGIIRAIYLNMKERRVVSGASTITMQTIRLLRKNRGRTLSEKIIEMIWALRLELKLNKKGILRYYSTHAPFGGNVVGLETASWRYFNRPPQQLTWAESAMLAVLPNAPGLIHLGKNRDQLKKKRNKLLKDIYDNNDLSLKDYQLAVSEPLPEPLHRLPHYGYHFINRFNESKRIASTINIQTQQQFNAIASNYSRIMKRKNIHNLSAVVLDIHTGEILAYVGNIYKNNDAHAGKVDMLNRVRSSGSILKPLLYNAAIDNGTIAPRQLIPDFPINFTGYQPTNYNPDYDGMVHADEALYRSLNVPAAWLLKEYGSTKFKYELQAMGLKSINRPANDYGLSLILGGAEVNLLQLTGAYAALAHKLATGNAEFDVHGSMDSTSPFTKHRISYDQASIYSVLNTLTQTYRPETEANWKNFSSSTKIAWKTGTSFGNRDAWAVGVTPQYAVGVWVGNSDGQGIPGLTGLNNAAPLLFQLFDVMKKDHTWFHEPYAMVSRRICDQSGMKATQHCTETRQTSLPPSIELSENCYFHKTYLTTKNHSKRVYKNCYTGETAQKSYLVLPATAAYYYKLKNPLFEYLPPISEDCESTQTNLSLLYPKNKTRVSLPLDAKQQRLNAKVFHPNTEGIIYWQLNGTFIGQTMSLHEQTLCPTKGENTLTLIDEQGNATHSTFEII